MQPFIHEKERYMGQQKYCPRPVSVEEGEPVDNVEHAWLWSVQATMARHEGARVTAGHGRVPRPCEPSDIMGVVRTMNRDARLSNRHLSVLVRYGRRQGAPDSRRRREYRDARLWDEALDSLSRPLRNKGIVV
jgi:hypothetical protein